MKVQSAAKVIEPRGERLDRTKLHTMDVIANIVGGTLGPGGQPVLIERPEEDLPPIVTKDGVTVFKSLGFEDPIAQCIMEASREVAVRTANEAGDGPQPLWSKILTPTGFIEMRDVKIGMDICGTNGTTQKILGVYPKGKKEIFVVTFEQGQRVECCEDHLWTVTTNYGVKKVLTTKEMLKDYRSLFGKKGYYSHKYYVQNNIVEFKDNPKSRPLDPYLLGVLIGDRSLCDSGSVELSLGVKKTHIIEKLVLPEESNIATSYLDKKNSFRVKLKGGRIRQALEAIGLRNTNSNMKYIPKSYLMASRSVRESLLQGLIDTNGHVNSHGRFEFSTVSEQLALDFRFLCQSLGKSIYSVIHKRSEGDGSYSKRPIYRFIELKGNKYGNTIVDIKKTGEYAEMQCIKVTNPDQLYITDDFIVTHNTTTATILAEAIVRLTHRFCEHHRHYSPHRVGRELSLVLKNFIEPSIRKLSVPTSLDFTEKGKPTKGREILKDVALVSANGDEELATAVMHCYDICGDEGNVTLVEAAGLGGYEVEEIQGYPIHTGYEEGGGPFSQDFVREPSLHRTVMNKPLWCLYDGQITEINTVKEIFEALFADAGVWGRENDERDIIVIAKGFSEMVLGNLSLNWRTTGSPKVLPLRIPPSAFDGGSRAFLEDLAAVVGAEVYNPLVNPIQKVTFAGLGGSPTVEIREGNEVLVWSGKTNKVEVGRYRTSVFGYADPEMILLRTDELRHALTEGPSKLESVHLKERLARLSGGIARLTVWGTSNGDTKERRDRAEDAVCAVRGALKHGALYGGCWAFLQVARQLEESGDHKVDSPVATVLIPALRQPFTRLLNNVGITEDKEVLTYRVMVQAGDEDRIFDALNLKTVDPKAAGIYDSLPAVLEALRSSLDIATLIGTLGGAVGFPRNHTLEREEASKEKYYRETVDVNEMHANMSG